MTTRSAAMGQFRRIRTIVGRPVMVKSQLTSDEATAVIAGLEADSRQMTLPGVEGR